MAKQNAVPLNCKINAGILHVIDSDLTSNCSQVIWLNEGWTYFKHFYAAFSHIFHFSAYEK